MARRNVSIDRERAGMPKATGRPPRLSRDLAIEAAVGIVRTGGMAALTMRALADALDATPMALYRHVGDREELALLVVERVIAQLRLPDPSLATTAWLRALASDLRALGRAHPGVMDVLLEEGPAVRSALVVLDAVVRKLHDDGVSWKDAAAIHNTFFSWLAAAIRREEQWASRAREAPPMFRRFIETAESMSRSEYPGLAHVLPHMPGADVDKEFESSLSFMLDAVAARLAARRTTTESQRKR